MQSFHQEMGNQENVSDYGAMNGIATLNLRNALTDTSAAISDHRTPPSHHCSACGCFIKKRSHSSSLLSPSPKKKLLFSPSSSSAVNDGEVCEFVKSPLSGNSLPLLHRWNSDSTVSSEIYPGVGPRSPARAIASLPPLPRPLVRSLSDPPPLVYQEISPPSQFPISGEIGPSSIVRVENPKYKKMKEQLKEMIQQWEDIDNEEEEEENGGSGEMKNCEREEKEEEEEETETISVERHGNSLTIQLNCSCGKGSQILFSGKNCYHKLL